MPGTAAPVVHATCVAFGGQGVLVLGPSGAGKSALALQLMAIGADLVADDRVALTRQDDRLIATAPPGLPALIEARGIGLLRAVLTGPVPVRLVVDLAQRETERLPQRHRIVLQGVTLDLVPGPVTGHFPAAIRHYVLAGRGD